MQAWQPFSGAGVDKPSGLPLWNPMWAGGKPCLADPQMAVLYPINWLNLFLTPARALTFGMMAQLFLFGSSLYALCRHWKFRLAPALLVAICLMFGTLVIAAIDSKERFAAIVWGPLGLLLVSTFLERWNAGNEPPLRRFWINIYLLLGLACVYAVQYLAGYPQAMMNLLLMTGCYVAARIIILRNWGLFPAMGIGVGFAGVLALAICMAQLLPQVEFVRLSERSNNIDPSLGMASIYPSHMLTVLWPFLFGRAGYPQEYWGQTIFEFWAGTIYIGILPLIFLCLAPMVLRKSTQGLPLHRFLFWFFLGMGAFSLIMAAGQYTPVYMWFYHTVPGFNHFRWPSKFLELFMYSLAILSGLGLHALLEMRENKPLAARRVLSFMLVACFVALVGAGIGFLILRSGSLSIAQLTGGRFPATPAHSAFVLRDYGFLVLFLALSLGVLGLAWNVKLPNEWLTAACVAVAFLNLLVVSRSIYQVVADNVYTEAPSNLPAYRSAIADQMLVMSDYWATPQFLYGSSNTGDMLWLKNVAGGSLLQVNGVYQASANGLKLNRWLQLFFSLQQLPPQQAEKLADMMSIGYVVRGGDFQQVLWNGASRDASMIKRASARPRAYLVSQWVVTDKPDVVLPQLLDQSFDLATNAVVEGTDVDSQVDFDWTKPVGEVHGPIHHTWNSAAVSVDVARQGLLVTTETWYPGWKVYVDGKETPLYRVNYNYRGVFLAPGSHAVVFKYEPKSFRIGTLVSLGAIGFVLALAALRWFCTKRRSSPAI